MGNNQTAPTKPQSTVYTPTIPFKDTNTQPEPLKDQQKQNSQTPSASEHASLNSSDNGDSQRQVLYLSDAGKQAYKAVLMESSRIFSFWFVFGIGLGYTVDKFMPLIPRLKHTPNLLRYRRMAILICTAGLGYQGTVGYRVNKKRGLKNIRKDPANILSDDFVREEMRKRSQVQK